MSESINSNDSGFRSRQRQRIKRQQNRKLLYNQFKNQQNKQFKSQSNNHQIQKTKKSLKIQEIAQLHKNIQYQKNQKEFNQNNQDFDMFADSIQEQKKINQISKIKQIHILNKNHIFQQTDDQGYYLSIQGKIIGQGKYKIIENLGKGMFGSVIKVSKIDNQKQFFAVKIIRNNQLMIQSGQKQYQLLSQINKNNKKNQHLIKIFDYFIQSGHLCIVCQLMSQDLRQYVKKHQNQINLDTIKKYSIAMFMSLHQLRKNKIIHADIKPDNFLFTDNNFQKIKLCDFGTSYKNQEHSHEIQYLVARYYRAPEIILGYETIPEHRHHLDTWAVACSLYQLYTGQFLFNGSTNNQMLKQMMQTKGKFNVKMLKNSIFMSKHFDQQFNFLHYTIDPATKKQITKKLQLSIIAQRQLLQRIRKHSRPGQDPKKIYNFKDFLEKCLALNPKDRLTPSQAFLHPFLNYQIKLS